MKTMETIEKFENSERLVKLVKIRNYYIVMIISNVFECSRIFISRYFANLSYKTFCDYPLLILKKRYAEFEVEN